MTDMRRLPPRFNVVAVPFVNSVLMTFIVSGVSTWRAIGFAPYFTGSWMGAWAWSWIVAFPIIVVVMPLARRMVAAVVEPPPGIGGR